MAELHVLRPATVWDVAIVGAGMAGLTAACDGDSSVRITTSESGDTASGVLKVVDTLQCPQTFGSLTRKGTAQADFILEMLAACLSDQCRSPLLDLAFAVEGDALPREHRRELAAAGLTGIRIRHEAFDMR